MPVRELRHIYEHLSLQFEVVKIIERVTDLSFSDVSGANFAVFWKPKNLDRVEAFVRSMQIRNERAALFVFCDFAKINKFDEVYNGVVMVYDVPSKTKTVEIVNTVL